MKDNFGFFWYVTDKPDKHFIDELEKNKIEYGITNKIEFSNDGKPIKVGFIVAIVTIEEYEYLKKRIDAIQNMYNNTSIIMEHIHTKNKD